MKNGETLPPVTKRFTDLVSSAMPYVKVSLLSALTGSTACFAGTTPTAPAPVAIVNWRKNERGDVPKQTEGLILEAASIDGTQLAAHRSHASHASHNAHSSHYSGSSGSTPRYTEPSSAEDTTASDWPNSQSGGNGEERQPTRSVPLSSIGVNYADTLPRSGKILAVRTNGVIVLDSLKALKLRGVRLSPMAIPALQALKGQDVTLTYDEKTASTDGYFLAYVSVEDSATARSRLINLELLQKGYATFDLSPCRVEQVFREAEIGAREAKRGIWASSEK
jgi:hypothetical protein